MKKIKILMLTIAFFILPLISESMTCGCVEGNTGYEWQVSGDDCSKDFLGTGATRIRYIQDEQGRWSKDYAVGVPIEVAVKFCI